MAEKGIILQDATIGKSVACRDAVELDENSNNRIIQRLDVGKDKIPPSFRSATNLIRSESNFYGDGTDSTGYAAAGVFDNVIVVGDKSTLVVQLSGNVDFEGSLILPILLEDDETTIQGILEPQRLEATANSISLASGYLFPFLTWDVTGAKKVALAIPQEGDSGLTLSIYGAVI